MAALAVLDRESDGKVAGSAELAVRDVVHAEMLGPFFLNIEDVGMAVRAIEPFRVLEMRENGARVDHLPLRQQLEIGIKRDGFILIVKNALFRGNKLLSQRLDPVT